MVVMKLLNEGQDRSSHAWIKGSIIRCDQPRQVFGPSLQVAESLDTATYLDREHGLKRCRLAKTWHHNGSRAY